MKKSIIIPLVALALASCNSDEPTSVDITSPGVASSETLRTESEAIDIATRSLNEFYPTEARSSRDLSKMNVVLLQDNASRNTDTTNPLYVVNFGDNTGYAIVSANKSVDPLLAITESGTISSLDNIENPGVKIFVNDAMRLKGTPIDTIGTKLDVYRNDTVYQVNKTIFNRIRVSWGQRIPEGLLCPNRISGCVATAGAQALSYFKYPTEISLTFPERSSESISLNWTLLNRLFLAGTTKPEDYNTQLASLCREIGKQIDSDYSRPHVTLADMSKLRDYLKGILPNDKYIVSDVIASKPDTYREIGNGVIIMRGTVKDEGIGHCWVIHGCKYREYTVYVYSHKIDSANETLVQQFNKTELFSSINWGWNGSDDGYFDFNKLITSNGHYNEGFAYFTIKTK